MQTGARLQFTLSIQKQKVYLSFILLFIFSHAFSQSINGRVIDGIKGSAISFANVNLLNLSLQTLSKTVSDFEGMFKFEKLSAGEYSINISVAGYADTTFANISIKSDTTLILDLHKPCEYDKSIKNNTCPACNKKNRVIPIRYGLIIGEGNMGSNYFYGGCEVGYCNPHWYCRRDKLKF